MTNNRRGNILWLRELFLGLGLGVSQPSDVEIIVPRLDGLAGEAAPPAFIAPVLAFGAAAWIAAEGFLELSEVLNRQRARFTKDRRVGPQVIDPYRSGVRLVSLAALEEQYVCLHSLRVEDAGRQTQYGVQVAKLHHPCAQLATNIVFEQHVVWHHHARASAGL